MRPDPDAVYRITVPVPESYVAELERQGGGLPRLGFTSEVFIEGHSIGMWTVESAEYTFVGHPYDNGPSVYLVTLTQPVTP